MGYRKLASVHRCEIRRKDAAQAATATGSVVYRFTVAARGSLPAEAVKCRFQEMPAKQKAEHGIAASERAWNMLFPDDPAVSLMDRVIIETVHPDPDTAGATVTRKRYLIPQGDSRSCDSMTRSQLFHLVCTEDLGGFDSGQYPEA